LLLSPALAEEPPPAETTQILEILHEEEGLELFQSGELVPSRDQPLGPTSRVFEVTAQDILDQNARNVADALRFVPALFLSVGGTKNPSFASIRGLTSRQNVVFIDGRPVYDPFFGDVDLNNLPIDNVEKIKIAKGPVDAAYGPNAIGGVINIVTKRGKGKPTTLLTGSYESHNTQDYWLQHGGKKGNFNYYVAGSYRLSNGFPLSDDFQPTPIQPHGNRVHAGYTKGNVSANLGYDWTERDRISFLAGYYDATLDNPANVFQRAGGRLGLGFTRFPTWKREYLDLYGTTYRFNRLELRGNVYYDRFSNDLAIYSDTAFSQVSNISKDVNDVYGTNLQAALDVAKGARVKVGTFLKQDRHTRENTNPVSNEEQDSFTSDLFIEAEYSPLPNLLLTAGFNYDAIYPGGNRTIDTYNPRGSVAWQPLTDTRLHFAIGEKSRLPRLINLFSGVANPDLQAEKNFSVEVGGDQSFWNDRLELTLTWFRNDVTDLIGFIRLPGGLTQDRNLTSFVGEGVESSLSALLTKELSLSADYTYTNISIDVTGTPNFDQYFHQLNSRLNYKSSFGLAGYLQLSYVDGFPVTTTDFSPGLTLNRINFVLLNGKFTYEVWKGIKPYLAIENLFDSNYDRSFGFPESGRRFFIGVNARF
jgi:iron complex outermembrane receptor protein